MKTPLHSHESIPIKEQAPSGLSSVFSLTARAMEAVRSLMGKKPTAAKRNTQEIHLRVEQLEPRIVMAADLYQNQYVGSSLDTQANDLQAEVRYVEQQTATAPATMEKALEALGNLEQGLGDIRGTLPELQGELNGYMTALVAVDKAYAGVTTQIATLTSERAAADTLRISLGTKTLVQDQFNSFNTKEWGTVRPRTAATIQISGQRLLLTSGAAVLSKDKVDARNGAVEIRGTWNAQVNGDDLHIVLDASGGIGKGDLLMGIDCVASTDGDSIQIIRREGKKETVLGTAKGTLDKGIEYTFVVERTANSISFNVINPAQGGKTISLTVSVATVGATQVALQNSPGNYKSTIDNVSIRQAGGPSFAFTSEQTLKAEQTIARLTTEIAALTAQQKSLSLEQKDLFFSIAAVEEDIKNLKAYEAILPGKIEDFEQSVDAFMEAKAEEDRLAAEALKEAEEVPYARMLVTLENHGNPQAHQAFLTITFQSPLDQSTVEIRNVTVINGRYVEGAVIHRAILNHEGGTKQMENRYVLDTSLVNIGTNYSLFSVQLLEKEGGKILDQVMGNRNPNNGTQQAWLDTPQYAWGHIEEGRTVENPIDPRLSVVKLDGPNALVHVQSPHDQSVVVITGNGVLSQQEIKHEGGTAFGMGTVTMKGDMASGVYRIDLLDRKLGTVLDTVEVRWDKASKRLGLVNEAQDRWTADSYAASLQEQDPLDSTGDLTQDILQELEREARIIIAEDLAAQAFDKAATLSTLNLNNAWLREVQGDELYTRSTLFVSEEKMMEAFFVKYPQYKAENLNAYIDTMKATTYPSFTRGQVEDIVMSAFFDMRGRADNALDQYAGVMATLIQSGLQGITDLKKGVPEATVFANLETAVNNANKGNWRIELAPLGITVPMWDTVLYTCKDLYQKELDYLLQTQAEDDWLVNGLANRDFARYIEGKRADMLEDSERLRVFDDTAGEPISMEEGMMNAQILLMKIQEEGRTRGLGETSGDVDSDRYDDRRYQRAYHLVSVALGLANDPRAVLVVKEGGGERITIAENGMTQVHFSRQEVLDAEEKMIQKLAESTSPIVATTEIAFLGNELKLEAGFKSINLGKIDNMASPKELNANMLKSSRTEFSFELTSAQMVNIWSIPNAIAEIQGPNSIGLRMEINMRLVGGNAYEKVNYSVDHNGLAGESISSVLPHGTYKLIITDTTNYLAHGETSSLVTMPSKVPVFIEAVKYNTANIEGKISIEGSTQVMDVSLRVAEFDPSTGLRRTNYDGNTPGQKQVDQLDKNMPVWIIVHGRSDNELSDPMTELSRNLSLSGVQIVTVNWEAAARDNLPLGLQGSQWIEPVGKWVASQLKAAGFKEDNLRNVNFVGHSWGTHVIYEAAEHMGGKVNTMIALDPAADSEYLGGKYDASQINFARYATTSYAFHSSMFGNRERALTAQFSFQIKAPENYENLSSIQSSLRQNYLGVLGAELIDEGIDAWREHGFAVTLFSELLRKGHTNESDIVASIFSPNRMSTSTPSLQIRNDNYEGIFYVQPSQSVFASGSEAGRTWWKAAEYNFYAKDSQGNEITK